jgi:para-aminobenzoate synthetase/4-amino-4-deoxychorismate lyase
MESPSSANQHLDRTALREPHGAHVAAADHSALLSAIQCEIDFPLLPTLAEDERQRLRFAGALAIHEAYQLDAVVPALEAVRSASARGHWCVGFVAHEAAPAFDPALQVRRPGGIGAARVANEHAQPLLWFAEFASPLSAEPASPGSGKVGAHLVDASTPAYELSRWQSDTDAASFARAVEKIRADIHEGRFYQVNYTTRLNADFTGDAAAFFRALQQAQPRGYHVQINTPDWQLLSVSPELFFSLRDGVVTTQPMKGTAPRGDTEEADVALADALTHSEKERAENLMIVDLLRNDLSRIAAPHSVEVPHLFSLHALPSVWQMTSTVRAKLREGHSLVDVFRALFPCGSVTGAPKVEAMKAICELEAQPRGAYCGAIGLVAPRGACTFNVGIRTVWIESGRATCGVGSGITYDSTVVGEAAELVYKSRFVQRASRQFALFETILLDDGAYWLLERHLARIENSARHFRFGFDRSAALCALEPVRLARQIGRWRVRLRSAADGAVDVEAVALDPLPTGAGALPFLLASFPVVSTDEFLLHKTTRREVYDQHAPPSGVWDTLLWNERGELTEFLRANLVLDIDGERLTPASECGLLSGVLRAELLEQGRIREAILTQTDLLRADKVWWVNSLRGELSVQLSVEQQSPMRGKQHS